MNWLRRYLCAATLGDAVESLGWVRLLRTLRDIAGHRGLYALRTAINCAITSYEIDVARARARKGRAND